MKTDNKTYCVYIHINEINGKMYIGITSQESCRRWRDGNGYLVKKNNQYTQPLFARAILKYGWDTFCHEIIYDNLTEEEAKNYERWLIYLGDTTNPKYGYNLTKGGEGSYGRVISEETRQKISKASKGRICSEETRKKLSEANKNWSEERRKKMSEARKGKGTGERNFMYGKHLSEEHKEKLRQINLGKPKSEEAKRKNSEAHKGENNPKTKAVRCVETGEVLWGGKAFVEKYGYHPSRIAICCNDPTKTHHGYHFEYV